uniref:RING-type domain-containing protein n=1 Tax=Oryza punctata TaxID=4537 RepID=A0A0E0KH88_ORYPU
MNFIYSRRFCFWLISHSKPRRGSQPDHHKYSLPSLQAPRLLGSFASFSSLYRRTARVLISIAMAVDAHHLHRLPPIQPAAALGESMFSPRQPCFGAAGEVAGAGAVMAGLCQEQQQQQLMQGYQVFVGGGVRQTATPVGAVASGGAAEVMRQYSQVCAAAADAAESGVTFGGGQEAAAPPRKRKRAEVPVVIGAAADVAVAAQARQQLVDVDRLVLHHAAKMWAELAEQRRRHARQMVATVEAAAAKRLRAKDEEIERIGRLNWALEERLKGMYVEAQVWRDLAQSNEATANALRGELEHVLDAQARRGADDAESCCYGENAADDAEEAATSAERRCCCKGCGEAAAVVLLLPCRHLCACAPCAAAAAACPACGCAKNGSVSVNFS